MSARNREPHPRHVQGQETRVQTRWRGRRSVPRRSRRDWLEVPLPPPEKRLQAPRGGRGPQNNSGAGASPRGSQDKHREDPRTSSSASAARSWP